MIRHTGRYSLLISVSAFLPVLSLTALSFLDVNSGWVLQWLAVMLSGFGFSSVVTSVLIALIAGVKREDMGAS
jgi:hypothetical protein